MPNPSHFSGTLLPSSGRVSAARSRKGTGFLVAFLVGQFAAGNAGDGGLKSVAPLIYTVELLIGRRELRANTYSTIVALQHQKLMIVQCEQRRNASSLTGAFHLVGVLSDRGAGRRGELTIRLHTPLPTPSSSMALCNMA